MSQNLQNIQTNDDFIKFINNRLTSVGFKKDESIDRWVNDTQIRVGGGVMIINGRRQEMQGEIHNIKQIVEIFGEGSMVDVDTKIEEPFVQVDFTIEENGKVEYANTQFCFFPDEQQFFSFLINKIFGI